jgi:hypothetical protein
MTAGFLYDPERGDCIARFTDSLEVFDCCQDGRRIGAVCGNKILALDGKTVLGWLAWIGEVSTLPKAFRELLALKKSAPALAQKRPAGNAGPGALGPEESGPADNI